MSWICIRNLCFVVLYKLCLQIGQQDSDRMLKYFICISLLIIYFIICSRWSLFEGQLCLPTLMRKRYSEEKIQSDIMRWLWITTHIPTLLLSSKTVMCTIAVDIWVLVFERDFKYEMSFLAKVCRVGCRFQSMTWLIKSVWSILILCEIPLVVSLLQIMV